MSSRLPLTSASLHTEIFEPQKGWAVLLSPVARSQRGSKSWVRQGPAEGSLEASDSVLTTSSPYGFYGELQTQQQHRPYASGCKHRGIIRVYIGMIPTSADRCIIVNWSALEVSVPASIRLGTTRCDLGECRHPGSTGCNTG